MQDKVSHERGIPYECDVIATEGVGYAHSSNDTRKGKNGRSEGALLLKWFKEAGQAAGNDEYSSLASIRAYRHLGIYIKGQAVKSSEYLL